MSDVYKEFGVNFLRTRYAGPTAAEMEMAQAITRLRARVEVLEKTLKHAASVSHNGGLVGFSEHDALIAVRRLTLAYWGREHGEAARATVIAALEAQP